MHVGCDERGRMSRARWVVAWGALLFLAVMALGCSSESTAGAGLLAGLQPKTSSEVRFTGRLNDGLVPPEGSAWNSNRTTTFSSRRGFVEYDLGEKKPIRAVAVLADNNDTYKLLGSDDGATYRSIWTVPRVPQPGVRWRSSPRLEKSARYLKLAPGSGDASLSVAEIAVFSEAQQALPPRLTTVVARDLKQHLRSKVVVAGALLVGLAMLAMRSSPWWWLLLLWGAAGAGVWQAGLAIWQTQPIGKVEVSLIRGVCAAVAAAIALRAAFAPRALREHKSTHLVLLTGLALTSVLAFYNMGTAQFHDHKLKEPSHVHNYDMRVYFPVAKYFDELKYDGLYLASALSFAEEHGGIKAPQIQNAELRDLRDHRMRRVRDIEAEVVAVKTRFSKPRWDEFKTDMAYFWETMGTSGYLGSMSDHGGNATPAWLTIAYFMYAKAPAGNEVLLWGALLDPLLLLLFAVCVWRAFGGAAAATCLIVFGANDFYMFGTNWAGATLRNDWMVYLGLGACALKTKRYGVGGALLAMSALIRAFPAITLLALGVPVADALIRQIRRKGALPSLSEIWEEHRWFFRAAIGATLCVAFWVLLSSSVLGFDAWPLWVKKISSFTSSPHVNHVGWLTVVAGSLGNQAAVLSERIVLYVGGLLLYFGLAIWNARRAPPHRAALLGILMMPVAMYPANYYIHFIFLLPLLVEDVLSLRKSHARKSAGLVWAICLGLCAAQFFTVRESELANHFYNASVLLMAAIFGILLALLPRDDEGKLIYPAGLVR